MPAFGRINGGAAATDCAAAGASTDFDAFASIRCTDPNVFAVDGTTFGDTTLGDVAIRRDSRIGSDFGASAIVCDALSRTTGAAIGALSGFAIVSSDALLLR